MTIQEHEKQLDKESVNGFYKEFKVSNCNGRPVLERPYDTNYDSTHGTKCGDCGGKPRVLVFELQTEHWTQDQKDNMNPIWVHCGICNIG